MTNQSTDLFVFIDGFGWEIHRAHPWFLKAGAPHAQPVASILGYSNACIPSILCGRMPDRHLHWSSYFYSPLASPFAGIALAGRVPRIVRRIGRINRLYQSYIKRRAGFQGYFDSYDIPRWKLRMLDYYEKRDIFEPQAYNGCENLFSVWRRRGKDYLCLSAGDDASKLEQLCAIASNGRMPEKVYLHLNRLDGVLHRYPISARPVVDCLTDYQARLDQVLGLIDANGGLMRLQVFSDHGMCRVTESVNIMAALDRLGLRQPHDYFVFLDATMARFWFENASARTTVLERMSRSRLGRWLSLTERKAHGLDPETLGFYGEEIFLVKPGMVIAPNDLSRHAPYGMHGYDPDHKDSFATLLSSEQIAKRPRRITEILHPELSPG